MPDKTQHDAASESPVKKSDNGGVLRIFRSVEAFHFATRLSPMAEASQAADRRDPPCGQRSPSNGLLTGPKAVPSRYSGGQFARFWPLDPAKLANSSTSAKP
jgi:hypothetical protein